MTDEREEECETCEGHERLIRTIGNSTVCPYDDTVPCPDCQHNPETAL